MKASETQLQALLDGSKQYRIPLFQRPYTWQTENWDKLWDDILEVYEAGERHPHFLGSIVTVTLPGVPSGVAPYLVIDGQQRLTTLSILLAAFRDEVEKSHPQIAARIDGLYLKNQYVSTEQDRYKILPTQADRPSYFSVIDRTQPPSGPSRILDAYRYFRKQLAGPGPDDEPLQADRLERIILAKLEIVSITLGKEDNPYRIFESLNATGVPLSQADLLRNYVFMRLDAQQLEDIYKHFWMPMQESLGDRLADLFRHEYMRGGQFVREGDVYQEWKEHLDPLSEHEVYQWLETLSTHSNYYKRLIEPSHEPHPKVQKRLLRLKRWGGQTVYPFLLWVYDHYASGELSGEGFAEILVYIESFLVRRLFANIPTNALNRLFLRLSQQLPAGHDLVTATRIALSDPGRRWPTDDEFRQAILTYPLYLDSRHEQCRLILEALEESFGHREAVDVKAAQPTIEHALPQNLTPEWRRHLGSQADLVHQRFVHTLGNLTLTSYNSELSNRPWEEKRERLRKSHFDLNKSIAEARWWTEKEILQRGRELAERAIKVWPGPVR